MKRNAGRGDESEMQHELNIDEMLLTQYPDVMNSYK
jgi:hypothetical protein